MTPAWLHPLVRLTGLWLIVAYGPFFLTQCVMLVGELVRGDLFARQGFSWIGSIAHYGIGFAAGLWFFFGTRHVISIVMRGRFAAHCCQHCGYDPGPNRPERCPECARAFPTDQVSPPSSSAST